MRRPLPAMWLFASLLACAGCIIVEPLHHRTRVVARQGTSLTLADNETITLPGVQKMMEPTPLLDAACERGVRLVEGRPVGQMRIWHWCGNDFVRYHLVRVDLANLAVFAGEGIPEDSSSTPESTSDVESLSKWGWKVDEYERFKKWEASQ